MVPSRIVHTRVDAHHAQTGVPPRLDPVGATVLLGREAFLELCRRLRELKPKIGDNELTSQASATAVHLVPDIISVGDIAASRTLL